MKSVFILDPLLITMLGTVGADTDAALRHIGLNPNVQKSMRLSQELYFRFMERILLTMPGDDAILQVVNIENLETLSAPCFAALCSRDGDEFLDRMVRYKRIVCPIDYDKVKRSGRITLKMSTEEGRIPRLLAELEVAFIVRIMRLGAGASLKPLGIGLPDGLACEPLADFFVCPVRRSAAVYVEYSERDMKIPFTTYNESMWETLKPGLENSLMASDDNHITIGKVRRAIAQLLPGRSCSVSDVAEMLCVSRRTLQRKLSEEGASFSDLLNDVRFEMSKAYLPNPDVSVYDIAYLLGFTEKNSFLRAFKKWAGCTFTSYRNSLPTLR